MHGSIDTDLLSKPTKRSFKIMMLSITAIILWTMTLMCFYFWQTYNEDQQMVENATVEARSCFLKDVIYRKWNTNHGGLYAPVTETTQPNPYLPENIETSAVTSSGIELTLVNPAYMARQINELAESDFGMKSRITSLNPIRPTNSPDEWETYALTRFEQGAEEVRELNHINGQEYLRLMKPFVVEEGCLKCHEQQGYKVGDIRGGISVSVSMAPYRASADQIYKSLLMTGLSVWFAGMVLIVTGSHFLSKRIKEREDYENHIVESNQKYRQISDELNLANSEMVLFSEQVTTNLRTNLRHIEGFNKIMLSNLKDVDSIKYKDEQAVIQASIQNLRSLIKKLDDFYRSTNKSLVKIDIDISEIFDGLVKDIGEEQASKSIQWDVQPGIHCKCDPTLIKIALENMILNAIRFTSSVSTPKISFGVIEKEGESVLFVSDNGPGFSTEASKDLFAPYVKIADHYEEGVGIGLAIVEKVVSRHGGKVWAKSEPGKGATFFFTL